MDSRFAVVFPTIEINRSPASPNIHRGRRGSSPQQKEPAKKILKGVNEMITAARHSSFAVPVRSRRRAVAYGSVFRYGIHRNRIRPSADNRLYCIGRRPFCRAGRRFFQSFQEQKESLNTAAPSVQRLAAPSKRGVARCAKAVCT